MLTQAEAKAVIVERFRDYLGANGVIRATAMDAQMFWEELLQRDPGFRFAGQGEPWLKVRSWLLEAGMIKDL
ncbi:hypothetical protein [Plastoroseomonas hellenica]|uniref:Uncharacterized protein n=1 Tax=Plastoroseomonas hellenica TaxID=2687306 RepID=A0ABS5EYR8_9PROT|nr:hypothetical protein [Plastoroseomonas hellenica]MBR0647132.1 hypothetical protein [Plastoroseomonas hellenica]MBR0665437.1 hypothetical protein [Plastoroseomonas hellenica]